MGKFPAPSINICLFLFRYIIFIKTIDLIIVRKKPFKLKPRKKYNRVAKKKD